MGAFLDSAKNLWYGKKSTSWKTHYSKKKLEKNQTKQVKWKEHIIFL